MNGTYRTYTEEKSGLPVVKVIYSKEGYGLKEAYRLLAKKVLETKKCRQRYTSE